VKAVVHDSRASQRRCSELQIADVTVPLLDAGLDGGRRTSRHTHVLAFGPQQARQPGADLTCTQHDVKRRLIGLFGFHGSQDAQDDATLEQAAKLGVAKDPFEGMRL
jgi:hypothetical protein